MKYFQITVTEGEPGSEHPSAPEGRVERPDGSPAARVPNRLYADRAAYQSVFDDSDVRLKRNIRPI